MQGVHLSLEEAGLVLQHPHLATAQDDRLRDLETTCALRLDSAVFCSTMPPTEVSFIIILNKIAQKVQIVYQLYRVRITVFRKDSARYDREPWIDAPAKLWKDFAVSLNSANLLAVEGLSVLLDCASLRLTLHSNSLLKMSFFLSFSYLSFTIFSFSSVISLSFLEMSSSVFVVNFT